MSYRPFPQRRNGCRELYCTQKRLCMQCHLFVKVELLERKVKTLEEQAKEYEKMANVWKDIVKHDENIISIQKQALEQVEKLFNKIQNQ